MSTRSNCRVFRVALRGALPLLLAAAVGLPAAAPSAYAAKKKEKQEDTRDEAEKSFDKASKSFRKGYYDDALAEFERLRNNYPFSKFAVEAELKIADTYFKKREYADAADTYRTFAKLHPKHEKVDYASFRVGLALFKDAPKSVDRDQTSTERALEEFRTFITAYPDSKYADEASRMVGEGRDRLAAKEVYVARFYVKRKKWTAARTRLETVVARYPDAKAVGEATWLLGLSQYRSKQNDRAADTLNAYLEKYPGGEFARDARKILARLGKPASAVSASGDESG